MKSTKIIATIGPATDSQEQMKALYEAGMDVIRLNCSHGNHEYFTKIVSQARNINEHIAVLLDTKGPEVRSGKIEGGSVQLKDGQELILTTKELIGSVQPAAPLYGTVPSLVPWICIIGVGCWVLQLVRKKGTIEPVTEAIPAMRVLN